MQKRFPHYLRPTTGGRWPQAIVCVDCQSVPYCPTAASRTRFEALENVWYGLLVRHLDSYRGVMTGKLPDAYTFWSELSKRLDISGSLWVVSYRASIVWTLLGLWEEIENGRVVLFRADAGSAHRFSGSAAVASEGYLVAEDPPNICRFRLDGLRHWCQWVDVRNYGMEIEDSVARGRPTVLWLLVATQKLADALHSAKLGSLKATAGSQALHGFRTSYYTGGIYVHNHDRALGLEAAAYYGGRCECRVIGVCGEVVHHLDFRSLYPACCAYGELPVRLRECRAGERYELVRGGCAGYGQIADCDLETDEPAYPYRRNHDGSDSGAGITGRASACLPSYDTDIIYPVGRFRTVLCGPELSDAMERGRIRRIHRTALYEMEPALRDYALAIYEMRCHAEHQGNAAVGDLAKRLSVCLPGKFGQRLRVWEPAPDCAADRPYGVWWGADLAGNPCRYRSVGWTVWRECVVGWSQEAVPAIAGWITSAGRMALLAAIRMAGWDNVLYYDTDSLFVTEVGYGNLIAADQVAIKSLGRLDYRGHEEGINLRGIKSYVFGGRTVDAGNPRGTARVSPDGSGYWYTSSAGEQIRQGKRPSASAVLRLHERHEEYRHGVVREDGRVRPIELNEW